ncbi:MAG TPA: 16S rRNA (cytosine(1402)-N(4))-methyltransferase RsmH [Patescibacteria group bacterium]
MKHIPVLMNEVMVALQPRDGGNYIDATLGDGGHTEALLEASGPTGRVLGLDQDPGQLAIARERLTQFGTRAVLVQSRFGDMQHVAEAQGFSPVDGILFDLGISSRQLDDPKYGLNIIDDTPLDMRLSPELDMSAADFLTRGNEREIADVLYLYGDRHNSRTLAHKIVNYRRKQVFQVAHDLKEALNLWRPMELAPIFQALRIHVNREYEQLEKALPAAIRLLKPGGVLAIISFHSGEDRIVKRFLLSQRELLEVSKKIIQPAFTEVKKNSRARSAKLRLAYKK